jgi:hypothetical protein
MSLYRQAGGYAPRALAGTLIVGVVLGALAGFLAGRGSVSEPSAAEVVADARAELRPVAAGLELVPIEYEGEADAAASAAIRAQQTLVEAADDMRAIDPVGYTAATRAVSRLRDAIDAVAPPARIEALARAAEARIDALAGA